MRSVVILGIFLLCIISSFSVNAGEPAGAILPPLERAMSRLDTILPEGPEGIWEYPLDEVTVLIVKDRHRKGEFLMTVLEAFDERLHTGDTIGHLLSTPDHGRFRMRQYTEYRKRALTGLQTFEAKLSDNGRALLITSSPKFKVTVSPWRLLPRFLQVVRIREGSGKEAPEGLRRVYPSADGPGLKETSIVIL